MERFQVTNEDVDEAADFVLDQVLVYEAERLLTAEERLRMRLALAHPSPEVEALLDRIHSEHATCLAAWATEILNTCALAPSDPD